MSSSLTFSQNWRKHKVEQKVLDLPEYKVEKILKGSLDLILSPSPSVKIQIIGGKVCLRCKGKTLLGIVKKLLKTKNNHVMQNWRVQKVKQNVFDLPSGMVKVLRILKTWMDCCVDLERIYDYLNFTAHFS